MSDEIPKMGVEYLNQVEPWGSEPNIDAQAEKLAERFHETYERLASGFGYKTRGESAVPWADVPAGNKALMIATCTELLLIDPPSLPPMLKDQAS